MTDDGGQAIEPGASEPGVPESIDGSRVRSFIGLSIGLVGPRANLAVSGVLITLFVQQRAAGALAVTFALTANRILSFITYPLGGQVSDRTRSRIGRRTPYMGMSLIVMGVGTWLFTVVPGYWGLVVLIVIVRQATAIFTLANVAVVPEVFGRSRWIKALFLTTVLGYAASLLIKLTVITTWNQKNPSTWNLPFREAAVIMAATGLAVLLLVRESPAAEEAAAVDRDERARPSRQELRNILAEPNAKVLLAGSLLFWSGVGSTAYVAILYFEKVLHAGASAQTVAGIFTGIPTIIVGLALGFPLAKWLTRRQLAVGAPIVGAALFGIQYFDSHLWQAVVIAFIGAPFIGAYLIALAPMLLQLLPRAGGLAQRLGMIIAPFNLCGVVLAYAAAAVVDATGNYRLIWLFPATTLVAQGIINCWLRFPPKREDGNSAMKRLWEWSIVQAEAMSETGIVAGLLAAPLMGEVTVEDADSAVIIDMARNILGNPYDEEPPAPSLGSGVAGDGGGGDDGGGDGSGPESAMHPGDSPGGGAGGVAPDGVAPDGIAPNGIDPVGSAPATAGGSPATPGTAPPGTDSTGIIDVDATERPVPVQPSDGSSEDGSR